MKNLTEQNVSGVRNNHVADDRIVRTLIDELMPGVKYFFEIYTISYSLESDIIKLSARTMPQIQSEVLVVNDQQVSDNKSGVTFLKNTFCFAYLLIFPKITFHSCYFKFND